MCILAAEWAVHDCVGHVWGHREAGGTGGADGVFNKILDGDGWQDGCVEAVNHICVGLLLTDHQDVVGGVFEEVAEAEEERDGEM